MIVYGNSLSPFVRKVLVFAAEKGVSIEPRPAVPGADDADRLDVFEASVAHPDGKWLASFPVGTEIVMFGIWKFAEAVETQRKNPRDPSRTTTFVTHKLTLQPKFKRQLIEVS